MRCTARATLSNTRCGPNTRAVPTKPGGSPRFSIAPRPIFSAGLPTRSEVCFMRNETSRSPIRDARVQTVIERLEAQRRRPSGGGPRANPAESRNPYDYAEYGFSIHPEQGNLIYLLCRGMHAVRVVE